jgi:SAM-dependent methyltransferase
MSDITSAEDTRLEAPLLQGRLAVLSEEPLETPSMLQKLGYLLTKPGKNYVLPAEWLQTLLRRSKSPLIAESFVRPGGWRSMEIIYRNAAPIDWLDRQALRDNPISMAARNRRKIISDLLTRLIRQHASEDHVTMLGIGAGPGWHIQTAFVDSGIEPSRVTAHLIDLDDDAFPYGRTLAARFGLHNSIHFLQGDASRIREVLPESRFQIAKLIGIIEYLTDEQLVTLLEAIREVMVPGGGLITHGFVDKYGTGKFLSRVFDLRHHQRDGEQLSRLLIQTGFRVDECEYEPAGIHPIITAIRK